MSDAAIDYSEMSATDSDFWQAAEVNLPSVKKQNDFFTEYPATTLLAKRNLLG